jgi:hypothetical protein
MIGVSVIAATDGDAFDDCDARMEEDTDGDADSELLTEDEDDIVAIDAEAVVDVEPEIVNPDSVGAAEMLTSVVRVPPPPVVTLTNGVALTCELNVPKNDSVGMVDDEAIAEADALDAPDDVEDCELSTEPLTETESKNEGVASGDVLIDGSAVDDGCPDQDCIADALVEELKHSDDVAVKRDDDDTAGELDDDKDESTDIEGSDDGEFVAVVPADTLVSNDDVAKTVLVVKEDKDGGIVGSVASGVAVSVDMRLNVERAENETTDDGESKVVTEGAAEIEIKADTLLL